MDVSIKNSARISTIEGKVPFPDETSLGFSRKIRLIEKYLRTNPFFKTWRKTPLTLFISVSDGDARASVIHSTALTIEAAWKNILPALQEIITSRKLRGNWLRIEWSDEIEAVTLKELRLLLKKTKRNYFRCGIAFDSDLRIAFLEQELNGNAMLYGGSNIAHAVLNENNFNIYARKRYGDSVSLDFGDNAKVFLFSTNGFFIDENEACHQLESSGRNAGRRKTAALTSNDVEHLVQTSSTYLARQVGNSGAFIYGYHPCFDREIAAYNALRHASSTYALIEAWEITRKPALRQAIDRALHYLTSTLIRTVTLESGATAAFLVEQNGEIKLGGNAVAVLALTKYSQVTGDSCYHVLLEQLAMGILHMQNAETGAFVHVLSYPGLAVKADFRIIYYEGEAAFGLMRLYELTGDERWVNAVERAFEHFLRAEHWKWHDHWLAYCVNELTRYRPDIRYFKFGIRNFASYLDFVLERITTFPTLLELMMAAQQMVHRIGSNPDLLHLLNDIDLKKFYRALHHRARYLLNGYFWPEMAMYFARPDKIVGSCFIRHHAFRIRIDDVEHYLSGFIAYLKFLRAGAPEIRLKLSSSLMNGWDAGEIARATQGHWVTQPPDHWTAKGISIHASTFQEGQMVLLRNAQGKGIPLSRIKSLPKTPAAIIAPIGILAGAKLDIPVLEVEATDRALFNLGAVARDHFAGKVIGVTGSAGKTTVVAMLSHALGAYGKVEQSTHNANLPHGVAWNLASFDRAANYIVLEMAVGRMGQSARMARPQVAVFTNIQPAHLSENSTIGDIARTKSAIFKGMKQGDIAVLNRDMLEWETVHAAARSAGLIIVHYGITESSDYALVDYSSDRRLVRARTPFGELCYHLKAPGMHMALNSLAVLAAVAAVESDISPALATFNSFKALPGRGEDLQIDLDGKPVKIIDDAYNANPGSMAAALERLHLEPATGRRIAVLGQMAELGPDEANFHIGLAQQVNDRQIDKIYAVGSLYAPFWEKLLPDKRAMHAQHFEQLKPLLLKELKAGDTVLFKGSNSTKIHELVTWLKETAADQEKPDIKPGTSALFFDCEREEVLFSVEDELVQKPASLTKLLTLCLVTDRLVAHAVDQKTLLTIPENVRETNSWWGFEPGEKVSITDLMRASIIVSANEASNVLATWHSGNRALFTQLLNEHARQIGMLNTIFSSPSGLGSNQKTTARDALVLARYVHKKYPQIVAMSAEEFFEWKGKKHRNTNRLISKIDGAAGLKTGSLNRTINNLIFSRLQNGRLSIAIVLGAPDKDSRDQIVENMFQSFGK
ncbi:Mur ligase family protein [Brucella intermedia]|uniref:Mur ligase family protein n=1 Tax=Brucella intermedia GD04153 TaxID=2975438 RepID=A0AA42KNJ5_9HYPH|nr:Mur ligase family protein [Brucella intermedia]MDH0125994.1 Mur ligase family protein [Brucella intermedia GD04153]NYD80400.1 UDP-N-acetylmuramoyl-tripeptide--D-alanyl-D-alanine ligase [Brucella intermedia]UXO84936.1 Mur ligase family protein [Brucella intermedia]